MTDDLQYIGEEEGFPGSLDEFQEKLGISFDRKDNLRAALTHPSYWQEYALSEPDRLSRSYERLEFLGDSVIALTVCTRLFEKYPDNHQGYLSKQKAHLVSRKVLLRVARRMGIDSYIRVGKGVGENAGRDHTSFMVDCFEAFVGAVYMEHGFERARDFVLETMAPDFDDIAVEAIFDYKTTLQEAVQKQYRCLPKYRLIDESGPEHEKVFRVSVQIDGELYGEGEGRSKKEAEINAAREALGRMNVL